MTFTQGSPYDVILILASQDSGKKEIEEFLGSPEKAMSKKSFRRVLRRISVRVKHPEMYKDGKMKRAHRFLAAGMLVLLGACLFATAYFCVRLAENICRSNGIKQYVTEALQKPQNSEPVGEITVFRSPVPKGVISMNVLSKSSFIYSVEYVTDDGVICYIQTPNNSRVYAEKAEENDGKSGISLLICDEYTAETAKITAGGESTYTIRWSDSLNTYSISGAKSTGAAVKLAESVYEAVAEYTENYTENRKENEK